jgi:hypothetical protein
LAFKVQPFNWFIPNDLSFKNISYVLDVYGASIYIAHHLENDDKQYETNFWEGKTFSCPHNIKAF